MYTRFIPWDLQLRHNPRKKGRKKKEADLRGANTHVSPLSRVRTNPSHAPYKPCVISAIVPVTWRSAAIVVIVYVPRDDCRHRPSLMKIPQRIFLLRFPSRFPQEIWTILISRNRFKLSSVPIHAFHGYNFLRFSPEERVLRYVYIWTIHTWLWITWWPLSGIGKSSPRSFFLRRPHVVQASAINCS